MKNNFEKRNIKVFGSCLIFLLLVLFFRNELAKLLTKAIADDFFRYFFLIICAATAIAEIYITGTRQSNSNPINTILQPIWNQLTLFSLINCGIYLMYGAYAQHSGEEVYFTKLVGVELYSIGFAGFITCIHTITEIWSSISYVMTNPQELKGTTRNLHDKVRA